MPSSILLPTYVLLQQESGSRRQVMIAMIECLLREKGEEECLDIVFQRRPFLKIPPPLYPLFILHNTKLGGLDPSSLLLQARTRVEQHSCCGRDDGSKGDTEAGQIATTYTNIFLPRVVVDRWENK